MIRSLTLAVVLALLPAAAGAQDRPSTTRMTCRQAAGLVQRRGAVVLGTGGQTFDRFVRDRSFCEATEVTEARVAPTLDAPQCPVGYRCREPSTDDLGDFD